jgi:outer membrane lipoprotein
MDKNRIFLVLLLSVLTVSGCNQHHVIPEHLEKQVNKNVSFIQIQNDPEAYRGKLVIIGGKILAVDRQKKFSRLEALQLPLSDDYLPLDQPTARKERFMAICAGSDPLDPEIVRPETVITLVGEVKGSTPITVEHEEKNIPVFDIKDLTIWDKHRHEGPMVEARGWYYSPLYVPYGYHVYQWSNCKASS